MFNYRKATISDLESIWNKDIEQNKDDQRYLKWKQQVTILFSPNCSAVKNRPKLCNGTDTANMNAFRIEKKYENQGHISKLVKMAEEFARSKGIKFLTIGSEAKESRNLAIYLHFGYTEFVTSMIEDNDLILYYKKTL